MTVFMNNKPQPTAAIIQPTGEVAVFAESIGDYLKAKPAVDALLANLSAEEADALKRGETVSL